MIVQMIKCDNPRCTQVGQPEEGGTKNKPNPPYGWLFIEKYGYMGCGPYLNGLMVCTSACVTPAIDHAVQEQLAYERGER